MLPPRALRAVAYFSGSGVLVPMPVLLGHALVGAMALVIAPISWRRDRSDTRSHHDRADLPVADSR
jgi:hypothetical protein